MPFFWSADRNLAGVVVNIACTSQETEGLKEVSADFWHETRQEIRRRLGAEVHVLPQCAAGDQSPHLLFRSRAEEIVAQRRGLSRRQEIACMDCGYLPTERGVRGGGYSADQFVVGPEGGQRLVNETVQMVNEMFR